MPKTPWSEDVSSDIREVFEEAGLIPLWTDFGDNCHVVHAFSLVLEVALGLGSELINNVESCEGAPWVVWGVSIIPEEEMPDNRTLFHVATYFGRESDDAAYVVQYALADMVSSSMLDPQSFIAFGPQEYFEEHFHENSETPRLEELFGELADADPDSWGR